MRRAELWNGNRESLRNLVSTDADRNIVLWTWRTLGRFHEEVPAQARTGAPDARVVVLTGHDQADRLVEELAAGGDHEADGPPPGAGRCPANHAVAKSTSGRTPISRARAPPTVPSVSSPPPAKAARRPCRSPSCRGRAPGR